MLVRERRQRLLEEVRARGSAEVDDLAAALNVSASTIRRDLDELDSQGHLRRTRGGAYLELTLHHDAAARYRPDWYGRQSANRTARG